MHKDKSQVAIGKRILYILFSVIISCFLWFYISVNENQDLTIDINGIPVDYVGEDVLTENNLIVINKDIDTLNLRLSGKRLTIAKLDKNDISVTADLSNITSAGTHFVEYTINYDIGVNSTGVEIVRASANYATVTVKNLVSQEIPVRGEYNGEIADGYISGTIEFTPGTVVISGPEDEISQVSYAWVVLSRDSIAETVSDSLPFVLLDSNGNEVNAEHILCSTETISVVQQVSMVKEVPLEVKLIEGAGADESNTVVDISPSTIKISGDPDILESINKITVGTLDLTSFQTTFKDTKSIILPDGVTNISGNTTAEINARVIGLVTTKMSVSNISVSNETSGYHTEIITQTIDVTLRGTAAEIAALSEENVRIVADLDTINQAEGTFEVDASVYVDGYPNVGAVGSYKINVRITKS